MLIKYPNLIVNNLIAYLKIQNKSQNPSKIILTVTKAVLLRQAAHSNLGTDFAGKLSHWPHKELFSKS